MFKQFGHIFSERYNFFDFSFLKNRKKKKRSEREVGWVKSLLFKLEVLVMCTFWWILVSQGVACGDIAWGVQINTGGI